MLKVDPDNYLKFRGRCREMSEAAVLADPTLRLARGYYHCLVWGLEGHWWTVRPDGTIYDPTVLQFPSAGLGEYVEITEDIYPCEQCGKEVKLETATIDGNHLFCSYECYGRCVGVIL